MEYHSLTAICQNCHRRMTLLEAGIRADGNVSLQYICIICGAEENQEKTIGELCANCYFLDRDEEEKEVVQTVGKYVN